MINLKYNTSFLFIVEIEMYIYEKMYKYIYKSFYKVLAIYQNLRISCRNATKDTKLSMELHQARYSSIIYARHSAIWKSSLPSNFSQNARKSRVRLQLHATQVHTENTI